MVVPLHPRLAVPEVVRELGVIVHVSPGLVSASETVPVKPDDVRVIVVLPTTPPATLICPGLAPRANETGGRLVQLTRTHPNPTAGGPLLAGAGVIWRAPRAPAPGVPLQSPAVQ